MRTAALALLLGGCLIVRTHEDVVDDPCPARHADPVASATGPIIAADALYFIGGNGTVSRLSFDGGPVSELTTQSIQATALAADSTDLYWAADGAINRMPLGGGAPESVALGYSAVTALVVDDTSVVWASQGGLVRKDKHGDQLEVLDAAELILGLGAHAGAYYYSVTHGEVVRSAPPVKDLASAHFPGPLVVDTAGVYFYEVGDPLAERAGALRLVPREGGAVVTTADRLPRVLALAADDKNLYFTTTYDGAMRVEQVSRFGGVVHTLACSSFVDDRLPIAVAGPYVYFGDGRYLYRIDSTR